MWASADFYVATPATNVSSVRKYFYLFNNPYAYGGGSYVQSRILSVVYSLGGAQFGWNGGYSGGQLDNNTTISVPFDRWFRLELETYLGTIGNTDGYGKIYLDGTLVYTSPPTNFKREAADGIGFVEVGDQVQTYDQSIPNEVRYLDNVSLATSRQSSPPPPPPPSDTNPPTVSITTPVSGATISGTASPITANASDLGTGESGVAGVQFKIDGLSVGAEDTASPYSISFNTTSQTNGSHTITALARDNSGKTTTSSNVTVTINNIAPAGDTTSPTVSISSPASNTTLSNTTTLSANASDNVAVFGVQFKLNGGNLGAEDTTYPYSITFDSTTQLNGAYSLSALARDAAGNHANSPAVAISINNAPIVSSISISPATLSLSTGLTSQLTGTARDAAGVTIPNTTFVWASTNTTIASVSTLGLVTAKAPGSTNISATASGKSAQITVSVNNPSDTEAPSIPGNLTTLNISSTSLTLSWNPATDNTGVTGYKIYRNGTQVGTSTTNTFTNLALSPSSPYVYTVSAYDSAGNNSLASSALAVTTLTVAVPCSLNSFTATPNPINAGQTTTLSWSTTSSCTGGILNGGGFNSFNLIPQSTSIPTVPLTQTTTYTLNFGAENKATTVTVNQVNQPASSGGGGGGGGSSNPAPTPIATTRPPSQTPSQTLPTPPPQSISSNSSVRVNGTILNVRSAASPTATRLGGQTFGGTGKITAGPVSSGGYNWYYVDFNQGTDGWVAGNFLAAGTGSSTPPATSTPAQTQSLQINSNVTTTSNVNVRYPPALTGARLGTQPTGAKGKIISGPVQQGGYFWYYLDFTTGADGWVVGRFLR